MEIQLIDYIVHHERWRENVNQTCSSASETPSNKKKQSVERQTNDTNMLIMADKTLKSGP